MDPKVEKLIDAALNQAVRANGPVKLYHGKHDNDGLFAKKKGHDLKAANFGFESEPPLWKEEPRSSLNHTLFVRLLPGGLERLLAKTRSGSRKALIQSASELYRRELLEHWADLAAARGWKADFPEIAECCSSLIDSIQKLVPLTPEVSTGANLASTEALDVKNADFKRRMAHELVIAWKFAPNNEAKQSIANALRNSGIQQIGEPSEHLEMDGGLHRCDGPAFPGDKVEVVESGWLVHDGVGEFLLEKAIVKLI